MNKLLLTLITAIVTVLPQVGHADWKVDPAGSYVGFASVKNDLIAENHSFTTISGSVDESGQARIEIDLASVETMIPIRNERMQAMLFNTAEHPLAVVSSEIPVAQLTALSVGDNMTLNIGLDIDLHGMTASKDVPVKVVRSGEDAFEVSNLGPIIVHASQFALADGVEALRKIAGLQSIDLMVPVTFDLRLVASATE